MTPPSRALRTGVALALAFAGCTATAGCSSPTAADYRLADCAPVDRHGHSVARVWDEMILSLIRQVVPAPTVHARNLFHTSVAMWDAWAAYDADATGYVVDVQLEADDITEAREVAISYAAYRILLWRYATVSDLAAAPAQLDAVMEDLCLRPDYAASTGDSPADLGNRIAAAVLAFGEQDGSLEEERYVDQSYQPVNDPLEVDRPGATMRDPNRWQPLSLGEQLSQNGLAIPGKVQTFIGPHWGHVAAFALDPSPTGTPIDPGPPPRLGDQPGDTAYQDAAVAVLRFSSELDPADGVTVDIGPGSLGDNTLGTNDGNGHEVNPFTGRPYAPHVVLRGDYQRAMAEYWADGPSSETPPGHWNLIANQVADSPAFERRIGGTGPEVDPLEWDVKTYFALNGALHDAAIAAWGLKGLYDSARPMSMIRYLAGNGQSSDPAAPSYDPHGLPLVADLIELITDGSAAPGARHAHLADHVGEIAVRAWRGFPDDPEHEASGVGWILGVEWVPYQRATFVTPAFAGYVSGHSTFSRAGAEVLTAVTGSEWFPGGLSEWTSPRGGLLHEEGPTEDVTLQWATYFDAADQAGISRLYMGIHIPEDDGPGRVIGAACGRGAWAKARQYFGNEPDESRQAERP